MGDFNHPFDVAREEMKSDWKVKIADDLTFGFSIASTTSIAIHFIFGPTSLLVRTCCFAIVCPMEFYHLLKGVVISPFFTARFFTTAKESKDAFRATFVLAGYVATLLGIRFMFAIKWMMGAVWGRISWTIIVSIITFVAGIMTLGRNGVFYLNKLGPPALDWMARAYYLSLMKLDGIHYWLSETKIWSSYLWVMRAAVRAVVWYPNPTSLPNFKFPGPGSCFRDLNLEISKGHFRLLHIRRQIPFLEVYAELQSYTLGDNPEYECISYCWGQREMQHSAGCSEKPKHMVPKGEVDETCCKFQPIKVSMHLIVLNGRQHYVPTNVHDILRRRSSFLRSSYIWIDSICIDQINLEEKNRQVPMMRSIYEKASHVYVCLGEDRNAWLAMAMVNELVLSFFVLTPENFSVYVSDLYLRRLSDRDPVLNARIEAFYQLLCNKWFTRVWVFQ
ncbi:hypothetical protein ONS96_005950 [Cadophora gregata f. sp. sojae]|nr:hypothetical protein ONS96_005950 [Cadophora gregata f. sp. sojae]